jgi:hypothetical protein
VLGARAYPGGGMNPILHDRVRRAAELYRAGKVSKVIVSGAIASRISGPAAIPAPSGARSGATTAQ